MKSGVLCRMPKFTVVTKVFLKNYLGNLLRQLDKAAGYTMIFQGLTRQKMCLNNFK